MSSINGVSSSSYIYAPITNNTTSSITLPQDLTTDSSDTSTSVVNGISTQLDQLNQGINPDDTISSKSANSQTSPVSNSYLYTPEMVNYTSGLSVIQGVGTTGADASTEAANSLLTSLSSQLSSLNLGINKNSITGLPGAQASASSTNVVSLGSELNLLNSGVNFSNLASQLSNMTGNTGETGNTQQASSAGNTNILNYAYNPSSGITTNPNDQNASQGSTIDLQV